MAYLPPKVSLGRYLLVKACAPLGVATGAADGSEVRNKASRKFVPFHPKKIRCIQIHKNWDTPE